LKGCIGRHSSGVVFWMWIPVIKGAVSQWRGGMEAFADRVEADNEGKLRSLRDAAERDFREGRAVSWEDIKTHNGL